MKIVALNKSATFEYEILEKYVAGIALKGHEIKSVRQGNLSLKDGFAVFRGSELFLINVHIAKYANAFDKSDDEKAARKLLLTKRELKKLIGHVSLKGSTLLPLKAFIGDSGFLKIEIGVGKHKKMYDKRRDLKEREANRSIKRELKYFNNED